jgi:hypothetical protein
VAGYMAAPQTAECSAHEDAPVCAALNAPDAEIYPIDVSFAALADKSERHYLDRRPTSFYLRDEAVDRLRAAAGKIILASPEFQRLLKDAGGKIVVEPEARDKAAGIPASGGNDRAADLARRRSGWPRTAGASRPWPVLLSRAPGVRVLRSNCCCRAGWQFQAADPCEVK